MAAPTISLADFEEAPGYGRYPHRGRYFRNAVIGLATFALTCLALNAILPFPEIPEVTAKLQYFEQHKNEFDTIFIGSSRVYHHVIPEVFDRVAAEHGVSVRSFNLGVGGMHPPESFYLLEQVLRARPAHLKWVFLEFEELYPNFSKEKLTTRRFQYWHSWSLTRLALGKTLNRDGRQSWSKMLVRSIRSDTVRMHLQAFLKNFANVGDAKDLRDWLTTRSQRRFSSTWRNLEHEHGYLPSFRPMTAEEIAQYREKAQNGVVEDDDYAPSGDPMGDDQVAEYEARLKNAMAKLRPHVIDPITDKSFRACAAKVRAADAQLIYIVSPNTNLDPLHFRGPDNAPAPVFAFNDINKYAALYDRRMRVDPTHMTTEGANLLSRLLAERFVAEANSTSSN